MGLKDTVMKIVLQIINFFEELKDITIKFMSNFTEVIYIKKFSDGIFLFSDFVAMVLSWLCC